MRLHEKNRSHQRKYDIAAWYYDILDYPWELQYRKWRPRLVGDMHGEVLEAGVGTGRNLKYYQADINLTALDFSHTMLRRAMKRARNVSCGITFVHEDACSMDVIPSNHYDWVLATFLCCVLPEELQDLAIGQFVRVLKPGGRFRLLEMIYSNNPVLRKRQDFFAPFVEKVYGARFDRNTLDHVKAAEKLRITDTRFLKHDVYLLIEGIRED
jgi:demethylmenaquinone methyltransferase/2-methoxy-6-polyprenyl-1,4-benzoquinol methylase